MTTFIMTWARVRLVVVAIHSFAQSFGEREKKKTSEEEKCARSIWPQHFPLFPLLIHGLFILLAGPWK